MYSSLINPILAARGFDDWIQILIVIAVFGGPLLGNILKKITAHFTPEEDDKEPTQPRSPAPPRGHKPTIRGRKPSVPVAKPMTSPRRESGSERRAPVRPMPQRPLAESPASKASELKPTQEAPRRPIRPIPPPSKPPGTRPKPPAQVSSTSQDKRRQPARKKAAQVPRKKAAASKKKPVPHTHGLLVDLHEGGEDVVSKLVVPVKTIPPRAPLLGTRAGLRDAILLSEILAPPLALRDS